MKSYLLPLYFGLYLAMGVIVFGLSFNLDHETNDQMPSTAEMNNVMRSMACAIAWPLWASVQASKSLRQERH